MIRTRLSRPIVALLFAMFTVVFLLTLAVPLSAATQTALSEMPAEARAKLSGTLQMQLTAKQRIADGSWSEAQVAGWIKGGTKAARTISSQLVFVHMDDYPTPDQITAMEMTGAELVLADWVPPVGNHPTGFFLARVPLNSLVSLASLPFVERLGNGEELLAPQNDVARVVTGVNAAVNDFGAVYNQGEGIRVAVLDSGIDLEHPDIPDPVFAVDYSEWPDSNFTVGNTVTGHGTHVAGTVLGRGTASNGLYAGMATDAELVFLKIGDDAEALETAAGVAHSFIAARDYYDCDVASMSYGYFNEFMDGSAENEQAVDYVVDDGMLVFISAGNSRNSNNHFSLTVAPNSTSGFIAITVYNSGAQQPLLVNGIAYDGPDTDNRTMFEMALYDNNLLPLAATLSEQQQSPRGTEGRYLLGDDLLPDGGTTRYVTVTNNSDHEQMFHLYIGIQTLGPYNVGYSFNSADEAYTVGSPALADSAIAVAAYVSKTEWVNFDGEQQSTNSTLGDIASFSSVGPRIDGLMKPDIAGPGSMIASARDGDVDYLQPGGFYDNYILSNEEIPDGTPGDYVLFQGTSMACPAASGATAAVLANWYREGGELPPSWVMRNLLTSTADEDVFTGTLPNTVWGYGKIDVYEVAEAILADAPEPLRNGLPREFEIVAAYPNPFNASATAVISLPKPGELRVSLVNLLGQEVGVLADGLFMAGRHTVSLNADALASGTYLLRVSRADGTSLARKVTVLK